VKSFSGSIVALVASPIGVFVLAALDSTLFVSSPLGIDAAVVMLAARARAFWWVVPLLASAGSLLGAALSFWMGVKIGEQGLDRYVSSAQLARARRMLGRAGGARLAVLDLLPPPFPFTPFILAAGALKMNRSLFFVTLAVCRLFRFGLEALLADIYGPRILAWLDSEFFHNVVVALSLVAVLLTIAALAKLFTSSRPTRRAAAV